ncbi:PEP-CTERM system TPR-repeat protein PrsT, partial [Mitsuaria sp. WAJ17]|nr:PEP-CTERM system TPR-repeat protein PrsT [Mitsuaria sp. WAJ17]
MGKTDTGFADLRNIAATDTGVSADMALISAHVRRRDLDKALAAIDAMERKQADKSIAANLRGQVMLLRKDKAGARKAFEAALAARADFFPAIASLAALDFLEGKPDAAK